MTLVDRGAIRLIQPADIAEGAVPYPAQKCGIEQVGYRDTIAVRAPDQTEVLFFKLPADGRVPVFEIFRVGFDKDGTPFRLTVTVYPADRNRFSVEAGQVPRDTDSDGSVHSGNRAQRQEMPCTSVMVPHRGSTATSTTTQ